MKCPICQQYERKEYAWLSDAEGTYRSDDHYDCANCGPISKEQADLVAKRIAELEEENGLLRYVLRKMARQYGWSEEELLRGRFVVAGQGGEE